MATTHVAKFGNVVLLVERFTDPNDGRRWVVQSPPIGEQHALQDRGLDLPRTECELIFNDRPGAGDYLERFLAFRALAQRGVPQLFVHPLHGAYEAVVADPVYTVDSAELCVRVSCTFLAYTEPEPVAAIGSGVAAAAGPEAVGVAAAAADAELAAAGLTSSVPAEAVTTAEAWAAADEPDARAISLETASYAAKVDDAIESLQLATDLRRWTAYRAMVSLRYNVTRAAAAVTSETRRITSLLVPVATPLVVLCSKVYGARDARDRADQVAKLNGLRTPGLVPAGTTLQLPAVSK
jgi:hypothetical protein